MKEPYFTHCICSCPLPVFTQHPYLTHTKKVIQPSRSRSSPMSPVNQRVRYLLRSFFSFLSKTTAITLSCWIPKHDQHFHPPTLSYISFYTFLLIFFFHFFSPYCRAVRFVITLIINAVVSLYILCPKKGDYSSRLQHTISVLLSRIRKEKQF